MARNDKIFMEQLEILLNEYDDCVKRSKYDDASDILSDDDVSRLITRSFAAIERITEKQSIYYKQANSINVGVSCFVLKQIIGVVRALCLDIKSGYLKSFAEIVHADLFSDYFEMAQHLLENGYKDASAVIAGSTLEAHLKQLAIKFTVNTESDKGKSKKADLINADLVKAGAYNKLEQKNITAWLDLRNNAAHGDYSAYSEQEVELFLENIRGFI
ncbi:MAG: hypothetical protein MI892_12060, partial [Desulfobacterales bacterium]|nr:hypothetical protein [Desulfobacterales bacterium]